MAPGPGLIGRAERDTMVDEQNPAPPKPWENLHLFILDLLAFRNVPNFKYFLLLLSLDYGYKPVVYTSVHDEFIRFSLIN